MRLITRNDTSLAIALVASSLILFRQPLRHIIDSIQDIETQYHLDLVPALVLLIVVFLFHEYQKHAQVRADARAAAAEAAQARTRSEELEQLMTFGQELANALDRTSLQQTLWRFLPTFAHQRTFWALTYEDHGWEPLVLDGGVTRLVALEALAARVVGPQSNQPATVESTDELVLPLVAGGAPVGVIGISNAPELSVAERKAWGAATALIAISVRNMQQFVATRDLSLRDSLTGCFNRAHAVETLDNELRRARRGGRPLSLLMFDVDRFKTINDRLGHLSGDEVLRRVGAGLQRILRSSDLRCRYGGDEFMVVLPDTPVAGAEQVAESIRRELGLITASAGNQSMAISVSIGVAAAGPNDREPEVLIERADKALYESKRTGRNRVSTFGAPSLQLVRSEPPPLAMTS